MWLLANWKPVGLLAVLVFVGGFILAQKAEISHLESKYAKCQAQNAVLFDKINKQNAGIQQQKQDYDTMKQKLATTDATNAGLQKQLASSLSQLSNAKVPPTCRGALDWLKAQAAQSPVW